jgi:eukaryotic-like serine/threonine-protein kinase
VKLAPDVVLAQRYRLTRLLGEGGMGEVWAATNTVTGRPVALKRLLLGMDGQLEESARARFVLEAQAACAVEHPNVVQILDLVESEGEPPVIVMELLLGETLATKLAREHNLSVAETARLLLPVVSAAGTAHARGIVHRDLKPANIFLSDSGATEPVIKVLDFGIAKWLGPRPGEAGTRTQTGSTLGTPCYMAPEQATGERTIDHRADVWSLGIILYECLSGARPVEGENAAQMVSRLLSTGIMPIERLVPDLPSDVAQLVGRMLTRDPAQRIRDLRDVSRVLEPLAQTSAPAFGEPRVAAASQLDDSRGMAPATAPPVSHGPRAGTLDLRPGIGERARSEPQSRPKWARGAWAFAVGGSVAAGVGLTALKSVHLLRNPAQVEATPHASDSVDTAPTPGGIGERLATDRQRQTAPALLNEPPGNPSTRASEDHPAVVPPAAVGSAKPSEGASRHVAMKPGAPVAPTPGASSGHEPPRAAPVGSDGHAAPRLDPPTGSATAAPAKPFDPASIR